jgi:hypothetical protein
MLGEKKTGGFFPAGAPLRNLVGNQSHIVGIQAQSQTNEKTGMVYIRDVPLCLKKAGLARAKPVRSVGEVAEQDQPDDDRSTHLSVSF